MSWLLVIVFLNLVAPLRAADKSYPNIEAIEIISSPNNRDETTRYVEKSKNSEIVVGRDIGPRSRLVIKCNATYPVQIVYIGSGKPEFSTYTNVKWMEYERQPLTFEAEASLGLLGFQGALRVEDTGNYTCRSIADASLFSYYYLYVPGPSLFTTPDGSENKLYFSPEDKQIWIPCTVAHPRATVTLHKTAKGKLQCPAFGNKLAAWNPTRGFLLNLKSKNNKRPEGTYVCIGSQDDSFKMIEYKLISNSTKPGQEGGGGSISGKSPCKPSPCGNQAECNVVDGRPVCFCYRGLSGNPYSECNKERCHSNNECPSRQYCIQGRCTSDPCKPSPCGPGSTCESFGGRLQCGCQEGYSGKPPYCVKKCLYNQDCPDNELCNKNLCRNPCPGRCGRNAKCQVAQSGYNRTVVCTCPPGYFGDPLEECMSLTGKPSTECPPGYFGPGPPNCKKEQCRTDSDCRDDEMCQNKECVPSAGNTLPSCRSCGENAQCELSRSTGLPICSCPPGTTGDPERRCDNFQPPPSQSPCKPNPCPGRSICEETYFRSTGQVTASCTCPGRVGTPPDCIPSPTPSRQPCFADTECPRGYECIGRLCEPSSDTQCYPRCGLNAKCYNGQCICRLNYWGDPYVRCDYQEPSQQCHPSRCAAFAECRQTGNGRSECVCVPGYSGDGYSSCFPSSSSGPGNFPGSGGGGFPQNSSPCSPSPCPNFASCRVESGRPVCTCIFGYENDGYGNCVEVSNNNNAVEIGEGDVDIRFRRRNGGADETKYRPWFRPGYVEEDTYRPRQVPSSSSSSSSASQALSNFKKEEVPLVSTMADGRNSNVQDECSLRDNNCPLGLICQRGDEGQGRCVKPCKRSQDCTTPEICRNSTYCYNPCDAKNNPCETVANSECRVVEGNAICTCRRGYVGNPLSGMDCRKDGQTPPVVLCDIRTRKGCDVNSQCRNVDGKAICVCGEGYSGVYPDCKLRCQSNRDCFNKQECWKNVCVDPCQREKVCGKNAFCDVMDHNLRCECRPGFNGNPWQECFPTYQGRMTASGEKTGRPYKCDGLRCTFF